MGDYGCCCHLEAEGSDSPDQALRLLAQTFGGRRRLFDQCCILLCHSVEFRHGDVHTADACRLLRTALVISVITVVTCSTPVTISFMVRPASLTSREPLSTFSLETPMSTRHDDVDEQTDIERASLGDPLVVNLDSVNASQCER